VSEPSTEYEALLAEIDLAQSRLVRALTSDVPSTAEHEYLQARETYRTIVELHPSLDLPPVQRDALIEQLASLRSHLEECEGRR
jgi:ribosomal protein S15P/S13E